MERTKQPDWLILLQSGCFVFNHYKYYLCISRKTIHKTGKMKISYISFLLVWLTLSGFAQQNDSISIPNSSAANVSGIIDIRDLVEDGFNYWEEEFYGHWSGLFIGLNGFLNEDYSNYSDIDQGFLDNDLLHSHSMQINFIQVSKGLQSSRNTIGLVSGMGLELRSYRLDNNTTIRQSNSGIITPETLYFDRNQKSKLSSVYLNVPLLLEFQLPVKHYANRVYFSTGIVGSKRLSTHTKIKYRKDGQKQKLKTPGNYAMPEYKLAATLRFGYRWVNLYASYDLVPLFKQDKGPELFPWSVGISLLSF